jgi:hypothetical protein
MATTSPPTTNIDLSGLNLATLDGNHNGTVTKTEFYAATTNSTLRSLVDAGLLKFLGPLSLSSFSPCGRTTCSLLPVFDEGAMESFGRSIWFGFRCLLLKFLQHLQHVTDGVSKLNGSSRRNGNSGGYMHRWVAALLWRIRAALGDKTRRPHRDHHGTPIEGRADELICVAFGNGRIVNDFKARRLVGHFQSPHPSSVDPTYKHQRVGPAQMFWMDTPFGGRVAFWRLGNAETETRVSR